MSRFDDLARTWDDDPAKLERARTVARAIVDQVDLLGAHVVEDGCGTGLLGFALMELENVATVTFVDPSEGMRDVVAKKIETLPPQRACVLAPWDEVGRGRQLVMSLMVLHHVNDPAETIRRWAEWLEPGGTMAIADLAAEDGSFHSAGQEYVHRGFDPEDVAHWMRDADLEPGNASTVFTVAKTVDGDARDYPVWLLLGTRRR